MSAAVQPAPAVVELAAGLVAELEAAKEAHAAAVAAVTAAIGPAVRALVPIGTVIPAQHAHSLGFGRVHVAHGNAHGAQRFETVTAARVILDRRHLSLSDFRVDAWPLNAAGKRLGAGVTLDVWLFASHGPDDKRTDAQLLAELLARALS